MIKTQIIILAAGQGKRLLPLTKVLPKTMLKVGGTPIINHILNSINLNLVNEFLIVVGHNKEVVVNHLKKDFKGIPIKYIDNSKHIETNSTYSLWLTRKFLKDWPTVMSGLVTAHSSSLSLLSQRSKVTLAASVASALVLNLGRLGTAPKGRRFSTHRSRALLYLLVISR